VPDAVATPPLIVHEVGTNTAGLSPVVDSGTEVCTGSEVEATGDVLADVLAIELNDDAVLDGAVLDGAVLGDGDEFGDADVVGAAGSAAFRLPACLPTKNAATHSPIRTTNPTTPRLRLLDGLIELT
jgi:hypothetical protein